MNTTSQGVFEKVHMFSLERKGARSKDSTSGSAWEAHRTHVGGWGGKEAFLAAQSEC